MGKIIGGHYEVQHQLGEGRFGITYLVKDLHLPNQDLRAVKQLQPRLSDPDSLAVAQDLFEREAKILSQLGKSHACIPHLHDHFQEAGKFYLVQDYVVGHPLSQEIKAGQPWRTQQVIELLRDILTPLAYVHQKGVIHRDIKPDNLIRRHSDHKIVLINFGAVKEAILTSSPHAQASQSTVIVGTPGYMPIEQANGNPQLSSDVYAVGMVAIQALTGRDPSQLTKDPTTGELSWSAPAKTDPALVNLLNQMVRYYFSQRFISAEAALEALFPSDVLSRRKAIHSRRQVIQWLFFIALGFSTHFSSLMKGLRHLRYSSTVQPTPQPIVPRIHQFQVVQVNHQGQETDRQAGQTQFWQEDLGNGVTLDLIQVPGGSFMMGTSDRERSTLIKEMTRHGTTWYKMSREDANAVINSETPQHQVTVSSFWMGRYPITQRQYWAIMWEHLPNFQEDHHPVNTVAWIQAREFCEWLSVKTGRQYRLPSEAEWEYACRAGTTTPFYFGPTITPDLVNYNGKRPYGNAPKGKYRKRTTKVGSFPPNAFGLCDMHGNVWEWCADAWHENYENAPNDGRTWNENGQKIFTSGSDPIPIDHDRYSRVIRGGGSFDDAAVFCRSAHRGWWNPNMLPDVPVGFRVVLVA